MIPGFVAFRPVKYAAFECSLQVADRRCSATDTQYQLHGLGAGSFFGRIQRRGTWSRNHCAVSSSAASSDCGGDQPSSRRNAPSSMRNGSKRLPRKPRPRDGPENRRRQLKKPGFAIQLLRQPPAESGHVDVAAIGDVPYSRQIIPCIQSGAYRCQRSHEIARRHQAARAAGIRQRQRQAACQARQQPAEAGPHPSAIDRRRAHDGERQAEAGMGGEQALLGQGLALGVASQRPARRIHASRSSHALAQHLDGADEDESPRRGAAWRIRRVPAPGRNWRPCARRSRQSGDDAQCRRDGRPQRRVSAGGCHSPGRTRAVSICQPPQPRCWTRRAADKPARAGDPRLVGHLPCLSSCRGGDGCGIKGGRRHSSVAAVDCAASSLPLPRACEFPSDSAITILPSFFVTVAGPMPFTLARSAGWSKRP